MDENIYSKNKYVKDYSTRKMFYVMITTECNMNCKNCLTCSPIAKKEEASIHNIDRTILLIKDWNAGIDPHTIQISGGDPFLHSDLVGVLRRFRNAFRESFIVMCCNGLGIEGIGEEVWNVFKELKIDIKLRCYDLHTFVKWLDICNQKGIVCDNYDHPLKIVQRFSKLAMLRKNNYNGSNRWMCCRNFMNCMTLDATNCWFYKCDHISGWRWLPDYKLKEGLDYFDYSRNYNLEKMKEVYVLPACSYCNTADFFDWTNVGERKAEEWLI